MNWNARLERATKRGHFTDSNLRLAGSWLTCAVGERARHLGKAPLSDEDPDIPYKIEAAGMAFFDAVCRNNVPEARKLYARIQRWGAQRKATHA